MPASGVSGKVRQQFEPFWKRPANVPLSGVPGVPGVPGATASGADRVVAGVWVVITTASRCASLFDEPQLVLAQKCRLKFEPTPKSSSCAAERGNLPMEAVAIFDSSLVNLPNPHVSESDHD